MTYLSEGTLHDYTRKAVRQFLTDLSQPPVDLYEFVIRQTERALLSEILVYSKGNLTKCAGYLGLHRATLRKKLRVHGLNGIA
jgi:Fis family transcriptional regulator